MLLIVLVLSTAVLVLEATLYRYPSYWSPSSREPLRSTIGIAADQTAIEYEYRFTEYRFAEYEYEENNRLTRSQRRGGRYSALMSYSTTRPSTPAWI